MKDLINIKLKAQDRSDLLKKLNKLDLRLAEFWEALCSRSVYVSRRTDVNLVELISLSEELINDTADLIKSKSEWKDDRHPRYLYTAIEDIKNVKETDQGESK